MSVPRPGTQSVALLGSYVPRQCGIATFSADLADALRSPEAGIRVDSIAMSDQENYTYPECVAFEIPEEDLSAYAKAADYINRSGYDILSVQHEYGIFGGEAGSYLLSLLRESKMPIVTTLHTLLRDPSPWQRAVMDELLQLSERVVVMSQKAIGILVELHGVRLDKIDLIPHGIPKIEHSAGAKMREQLGITGPMILTFGLISPDKGFQYVIEAMPRIVKECPGATYVVVGTTHPRVRMSAGESYRESLVNLAAELGVSENVRFVDRFVPIDELVEYLAAMDVYITPYLKPQQITSGTLAYALGAGKAVISTPYWYAEELLADGRGLLVPFRDANPIADAILALDRDAAMRDEMGRKAEEFCQQMLWPEVGKRYLATFDRARHESRERMKLFVEKPSVARRTLPALRLDHLAELTDDTGIIQHAKFTIPDRSEGYCVDDNARALILTAYMEDDGLLPTSVSCLQHRYLSFLLDAFNHETGRFRNFMRYDRKWLDNEGSEDSHGRTMWALGTMVHRSANVGRRDLAESLFSRGVAALLKTGSPRTWAYGVLAAHEFLGAKSNAHTVADLRLKLANRLMKCYRANRSPDWPWFEQSLSYANARLSQALIVTGHACNDDEMLAAGLESLEWLSNLQQSADDQFVPIGTNGFYVRHGVRALFDQQPIEAWASLSAYLCAGRITGQAMWQEEADRAFRWFEGDNMLGLRLDDPRTGGCHDGLHDSRLNRNQGAESTLSYLCALIELRSSHRSVSWAASKGTHDLR